MGNLGSTPGLGGSSGEGGGYPLKAVLCSGTLYSHRNICFLGYLVC